MENEVKKELTAEEKASHFNELINVLQAVQASKSYNKTDLALMYNLIDQTLKKIIG